jgi:hypothetical protein
VATCCRRIRGLARFKKDNNDSKDNKDDNDGNDGKVINNWDLGL